MIQFNIFKQHLHLFFMNKLYRIILLLIFLSTTIGIGFYLYFPSWVFFTLTFIVRCIFYESFAFMIVSYLFLNKAYKSQLDETIDVITQKKNSYFWNAFFVLVFLLLVYNLYILLLLFINTIKTGEYNTFLDVLITQYPLNVLFPQMIFLLITALISLIKNTKISLSLFLMTSLLMSPYMDTLTWRSQPAFPIDKIVYYIHLPFALFLQSSIWPIDPLYGMQNEPYKIAAIIFWIVLFISVMVILSLKNSKKMMIVVCMSSFLIIGCLSRIYIPQDIFRLNDKWDGTLSDENYYDIEHRYKENIYTKEDVDYLITDYKLNIDINMMLSVEGELHLHSDRKQKDFVLTLYRQFEIDLLDCPKEMTYKQEEDYIKISFAKEINDADIKIKYHGYHDLYYSNSQGAQLPGFLPWYPMAGEKSVYFNSGTRSLRGINPYNKVKQANFNVNIEAPYPIICNLDQQGNTCIGTSDSLTIIGGNLERYEDNNYQIQNYFPYAYSPYFTEEKDLMYYEKDLADIEDILKNRLNVENYPIFKDKKIIVMSKSVARTQEMGTYAEFSDYILITENTYFPDKYFQYHFADRFDLNPVYNYFVVNGLTSGRTDSKDELLKRFEQILNSEVKRLKNSIDAYQEGSQQKEVYQKKLDDVKFYLDKIQHMNEEEKEQFLTEIGKTIIGEDKHGN